MRFSIIVPVYNVERFISECLDTLVGQTYDDYEIIVVDDGSPDNSGKIADEYAERNPKLLRVIHQENKGLSGARNTGLEHAKGDWIVFVDSDDYVSTGMLEKLSGYIDRYPADLYTINYRKVDEKGDPLQTFLYSYENEMVYFRNETQKMTYLCDTFCNAVKGWEAWSRIYKKSIIDKYHMKFEPTKEIFAEDLLFSLEYTMVVDSIYHACDILYFYRQVGASLLHTANNRTFPKRLNSLANRAYEFAQQNASKEVIKDFYKIYFYIMENHVTFAMGDVPQVELLKLIHELDQDKCHKAWMKKIRKENTELLKLFTDRNMYDRRVWFE